MLDKKIVGNNKKRLDVFEPHVFGYNNINLAISTLIKVLNYKNIKCLVNQIFTAMTSPRHKGGIIFIPI